ncbi:MAG: MBL fold metallo-hydrolase [Victivallaceae bacterium]|nr:MBL fold metallo-hydrolase [Victivallaceae bacterium]
MLTIAPLGSGSKGNALIISSGTESLAIDAGFSRREMLNRIRSRHLAAENLRAVLITHEHADHTNGCRVFCDQLGIPACMTPGTIRKLRQRGALPQQIRQFLPGARFSVGNFVVESFPVPHDAVEPVGFVVGYGTIRIGVATDLGEIGDDVAGHLCGCDALILESNYDPDMLANSDRELKLKRRIAGPAGHLENAAAARALTRLVTERTKLVLFAHVSAECNQPELVAREAGRVLASRALHWEILSQDGDIPCFTL